MKTTANANHEGRGTAATAKPENWKRAYDLCIHKTRSNIKRLADAPKSAAWAADGNYFEFKEGFFEIGNWTSSFFSGMALIAWQETEDEYFLQQVLRMAPYYREKVFTFGMDTHHDLGFLYSLYSVALYKLSSVLGHREVGLRAAELLSMRFNPNGNFIRAWGRMDEVDSLVGNTRMRTDNMAIIDSLMNLPLLFWAHNETGLSRYKDVAQRHADMCIKYFVRTDHSVNNIYHFHPENWRPLGDSNNTYWARGAAWAIYGFALGYNYTGNFKYLNIAVRLAKKFIAQLDDEVIPWNDFNDGSHPSRARDSSAGSVAVCAFQQLARHNAADAEILQVKQLILDRLCREDCLNFNDSCCGIQKGGQAGKNGYTSWGDYYLMEALAAELSEFKGFW